MTHLAPPRTFDHLRILDITNCSTISDAAIEGIVTHVPRIKNLILAKCTRLTDDAVYSIAKLGKNLHYLHLGHVSK
jgi:F-box and leucine-rich repeat protein GRR1